MALKQEGMRNAVGAHRPDGVQAAWSMRALLPLFILTLLAAACGGESAGDSDTSGTGVRADSSAGLPVAVTAQSRDLEVSGAWARVSLPPHENAAAFLTVRNQGEQADALTGIEVDDARVSELHTMEMVEADGDTRMRMQKVERMEIPAGGELVLKPGANHLMFFELDGPWVEGKKVRLRLMFENSPAVELRVPVRAMR